MAIVDRDETRVKAPDTRQLSTRVVYGVRPFSAYSLGDQLGLVRGTKSKIEDGSDLGTYHTQVTSRCVGDLGSRGSSTPFFALGLAQLSIHNSDPIHTRASTKFGIASGSIGGTVHYGY